MFYHHVTSYNNTKTLTTKSNTTNQQTSRAIETTVYHLIRCIIQDMIKYLHIRTTNITIKPLVTRHNNEAMNHGRGLQWLRKKLFVRCRSMIPTCRLQLL